MLRRMKLFGENINKFMFSPRFSL